MVDRPRPPAALLDVESGNQFLAAPEIVEWARQTFIEDGASLHNAEHAHLRNASIGALWTNVANSVHGGEKTIQWSACVCAGAGGVKVGHWIG